MGLWITGGRVIDPANAVDGAFDIIIESGKIAGVHRRGTSPIDARAHSVLDASGKIVAPGFIDIHTHLREPGQEYKETIRTGTLAAARGGFTTICCMPNTLPPNDCSAVTEFIVHKARGEGAVNVFPIGAVSKGLEGKTIAEYADMKGAGVVALSDDGRPVASSLLMRRAMEYAGPLGLTIIDHCEDPALAHGGVMHEGIVSTVLGLRGIPAAAEEIMVSRNIQLSALTGARIHIAHVSTAGSVRLIREAKARGVSVTAEATPHHLILTHDRVRGYDTHAKVNPPLRTMEDRDALRAALADGTIDSLATDHAPHSPAEKDVEFDQASFGISGLETALPLTLDLVRSGTLSLADYIARWTIGPARALGLRKGTLSLGADADMTIMDMDAEWTVDAGEFVSRGKNTPFQGIRARGRASIIVAGRPISS